MPTDGTLLLEHMPKGKQYLVTALSVFFSIGAVLSAVVAILVVPKHSCMASKVTCDLEKENRGWQYMLLILGIIVRITSTEYRCKVVTRMSADALDVRFSYGILPSARIAAIFGPRRSRSRGA